jgi:hypothetical protein
MNTSVTTREIRQRIDGRLFYAGRECPDGPWHDEPDHVDFEAHGLPCIVHRANLGAWCGYVAVPPGHPWHGKEFMSGSDEPRAEVHGGVTYTSKCQGPLCHVPKPGESDDVWWVGFDCAHLGDIVPGILAVSARTPSGFAQYESYKTLSYVRAETEELAKQAAEVGKSAEVAQ